MSTQVKTFRDVQVKDASQGIVTAVFSTFDVVDRDGDVVRKGALEDGTKVVISAYNHTSWKGKLPVGTGTITVEDDRALVEAKFFMKTSHGADTFETVKGLAEEGLGEWSYSLEDVVATKGTWDGQPARIITKIGAREVSPTLRGASLDTQTIEAKSAQTKVLNSDAVAGLSDAGRERWGSETTYVYPHEFDLDAGWAIYSIYSDDTADRFVQVDFEMDDDGEVSLDTAEVEVERVTSFAPKGTKFTEHAKAVLAEVDVLIERAGEVVALRATKGKPIASGSQELLGQLDAQIESLKALIGESEESQPDPESDPAPAPDVAAELLRFVAHNQGDPA